MSDVFKAIGVVVVLVAVIVGCVFAIRYMGQDLVRRSQEQKQSWDTFIREHRCAVVDKRVIQTTVSGGYPGTSRAVTSVQYLWRCDDGEHWHP